MPSVAEKLTWPSTGEGKIGYSISLLPTEDCTYPHRDVLEVDRK